MPRLRVLSRVQTGIPRGAYKITELHVAPRHRGRGIGTAVLQHAEEHARAGGYPSMALQTWCGNPARRLYERFGFRLAKVVTDEQFEQLTGVAGNQLMVKELA